jgi:hypothetical protein
MATARITPETEMPQSWTLTGLLRRFMQRASVPAITCYGEIVAAVMAWGMFMQ